MYEQRRQLKGERNSENSGHVAETFRALFFQAVRNRCSGLYDGEAYGTSTSWRQSAVVTGALRSRLSLKYWRRVLVVVQFTYTTTYPVTYVSLSLSLHLSRSPLARCVSPSVAPPPLGHQPKSLLPLSSFSSKPSFLPPTELPLPNPILPTHPEI